MSSPETKLYVGCSLANAPDDFKESATALKGILREKYDVLEFKGQIAGTNEDVYRWDIKQCVANCDMFVAVCDYPSIGLGWELNEAIRLGKPTLGLAHKEAVMSRLVLGLLVLSLTLRSKDMTTFCLMCQPWWRKDLLLLRISLHIPKSILRSRT